MGCEEQGEDATKEIGRGHIFQLSFFTLEVMLCLYIVLISASVTVEYSHESLRELESEKTPSRVLWIHSRPKSSNYGSSRPPDQVDTAGLPRMTRDASGIIMLLVISSIIFCLQIIPSADGEPVSTGVGKRIRAKSRQLRSSRSFHMGRQGFRQLQESDPIKVGLP